MRITNLLARLRSGLRATPTRALARTGKRGVAIAAAAALAGGGSLLTVASPALADGPVSGLMLAVISDGTAPFDAADGPGLDSGPNNGIVRTQDTVVWELTASTSGPGTSTYTMSLPAGMVFDAASAAAQVCTGSPTGGTLNAAKNVLTCPRTVDGAEAAAIRVSARVGSLGNGDSIALKVDVDGISRTSDPVTVSATPKTELALAPSNIFSGETFNGELGVRFTELVYLGATKDPANPNFFGYEALRSPFTFTIDVSAGVVPHSANTFSGGGGTVSADQPGGPGTPIYYTVTGANTNFLDASTLSGMPATMSGKNRINLYLFLPYEGNLEPGQRLNLQAQAKGFNPVSLSGSSNFGDDYAPGQAPGSPCLESDAGSTWNCGVTTVSRASGQSLGSTYGATFGANMNALMYGNWHGIVEQGGILSETAVPGQQFNALNAVYNSGSSQLPAAGVYGSTSWDAALLQLTKAPTLYLRTGSAATSSFYAVGAIGSPANPADYTLEYTNYPFADDADRKERESFADPAISWVSDPSELVGGISSVSSVRVKYLKPLEPNTTIGLATPLQRTQSSAALATGTKIPWFWQYGSDDTSSVKSTYPGSGKTTRGGNVQTSEALVRAEVSWEKVAGASYAAGNAERGDLVDLKITPVVIGPVGNVTTVAKDTLVTVEMPNACLEPVAAALPTTATLTPAVPGADCASGTPASIVFELGDLVAPGGESGSDPYQGHATKLTALQFPVKVALGAPAPATSRTIVTIDSSSDSSPLSYEDNAAASAAIKAQDKTYFAPLTVAGASVFKSQKIAATANPGYVGPGEEMTYTVSFANAATQNFTSAQFVDLLPFNGDNRGSTGFNASRVELASVAATMDNAAWGNVGIEYSSDDATAIQTALGQPNNEAATSGVTWSATAPADLSTVTALRFTPENGMPIGYTGSATIKVKAPGLALDGEINNNVSMVLRGEVADIRTSAGASSPLRSSAVNINGTVWRDLNFDGEVSTGDAKWPATTNGIQLMSGETVVAKAGIAADGSYQFPLVAAGLYQLAVVDADGWVRKLPATVETEPGNTYDNVDVLYQEVIADPILVDVTAAVGAGSSALIDVTAGDTLAYPVTPGSTGMVGTAAANTVVLASQPAEGSAQVELLPSGALSKISYTAPTAWPAAQDGNASFVDPFTYSWTNAAGVTKTATVNVTVFAPIVIDVTAAQTIAANGTATFTPTLTTDSGLASAAVTTAPSAGAASVDAAGVVTFNATGVAPGTYTFTVSYTDNVGQVTSQAYTVTVQAAPTATGGTATVGLDASHTFAANVTSVETLTGQIGGADASLASIDGSGNIVFAGSATPGSYTFTVTYTDSLGQAAVASYTVTVRDGLVIAGDTSQLIGEGQQAVFTPSISDPASLAGATVSSDPAAGTVTVDAAGTVTFDAGNAAPGDYTFSVTFTDDLGQESTVEYSVTIQAQLIVAGDTRKVAVNGEVSLAETVTTTGSVVKREVILQPAAGEVTLGSVIYNADGVEPGEYHFTVRYTDNVGQTADAEYRVTVQAAPIKKRDIVETVKYGTESVVIDVVGAVTGIELQPLTDTSFTQPARGAVALGQQGMLVFTPEADFSGTVTFTATVLDDLGQSVEVLMSITVEEPLLGCGNDCGDENGGDTGNGGSGSGADGSGSGSGTWGLALTGGAITASLVAALALLALGIMFFLRPNRRKAED